MKLKIIAETKWAGATEEAEIDTEEDLGISDEEWANLEDNEKYELLLEHAMSMVGFGWSVQEI